MEVDLNVHMRVVLRQMGSLELLSINRACNTEFLVRYILSVRHLQWFRVPGLLGLGLGLLQLGGVRKVPGPNLSIFMQFSENNV